MTIKINCGGTFFETTETTLMKSDFFKSLLTRWKIDETIFLDEDCEYFRIILIYLRDNVIEKNKLDKKLLQMKFNYYVPSFDNGGKISRKKSKKSIPQCIIDETNVFTKYYNTGLTLSDYLERQTKRTNPLGLKLLLSGINEHYVEQNGQYLSELMWGNPKTQATRYVNSENNKNNKNNKIIILMEYFNNIIVIEDIKIGACITVGGKYQINRTHNTYEIREKN